MKATLDNWKDTSPLQNSENPESIKIHKKPKKNWMPDIWNQ